MKQISLAIFVSILCSVLSAAPLDQLGVKPGSIHRITLGSGEINARVIEIGKEGWVLFSVESHDIHWTQGTKLWINLDRISNISAPSTASSAGAGAATLSESEIVALPCFPQTDYRDAQASAKGQTFDRNRFLTECISNQRKK